MSPMPSTDQTRRTEASTDWMEGMADGVHVVARILEREGYPQLAENFRWMVTRWQLEQDQGES